VAPDHGRLLQPHEQNASTRADYVAMVERLDHGVGQIVETLDRLGLRENTLVIYTNDNGGEWLSSNAPLFHRKDTLWEGGIRVPMVMRWPGHVPAASTSRQVGITMDLTASILAATGTAVPAGPALEGIDLLPILQGRTAAVERTLFFRLITESRQQRAVRQGRWKVLLDGDDFLIFDLERDIAERHDLANEHGEVGRRLIPLFVQWDRDVDEDARRTQSVKRV
jgi:arylsulfatase A-like enzyme